MGMYTFYLGEGPDADKLISATKQHARDLLDSAKSIFKEYGAQNVVEDSKGNVCGLCFDHELNPVPNYLRGGKKLSPNYFYYFPKASTKQGRDLKNLFTRINIDVNPSKVLLDKMEIPESVEIQDKSGRKCRLTCSATFSGKHVYLAYPGTLTDPKFSWLKKVEGNDLEKLLDEDEKENPKSEQWWEEVVPHPEKPVEAAQPSA